MDISLSTIRGIGKTRLQALKADGIETVRQLLLRLPAEYREAMDQGWAGVRVALAVEREHGQQALRDFYTAIGTRYHPGGQEQGRAAIEGALADVGLPTSLADLGETDEHDDDLRRSHHEGMDPVGDEVGTPVIHLNGTGLFGPVISPAPKGDQAGRLFDGFALVTEYEGFFELKRTRTVGPIFD